MGQPRRPDQQFSPPIAVTPPSPSAGVFVGYLIRVVGTRGGVFLYNPAAAAGDLVAALTATAGTDPFGNTYQNGLTIIDNAGGDSGLWLPSGASFEGGITNIGTAVIGSGGTAFIEAIFQGPSPAGSPTNRVAVYLLSETESLGFDAYGALVFQANSGDLYNTLTWGVAGIAAVGVLTAQQPGQTVPTFESWHAITGFDSDFAAGSPAPRYQLEPVNGGRVRLAGVVSVTGTTSAPQNMFTLPTGYIPANDAAFVTVNSTGSVAGGSVNVLSSGVVQCAPAAANGDSVFLDGIVFPLD